MADGIFYHLLQQELFLSHQDFRVNTFLRQEDLLRYNSFFNYEWVSMRLAHLRLHPVLLRGEQL